jgi:hypothetical protein
MYDQELQYKHGDIAAVFQWTLLMQMYGQALENKHD